MIPSQQLWLHIWSKLASTQRYPGGSGGSGLVQRCKIPNGVEIESFLQVFTPGQDSVIGNPPEKMEFGILIS